MKKMDYPEESLGPTKQAATRQVSLKTEKKEAVVVVEAACFLDNSFFLDKSC